MNQGKCATLGVAAVCRMPEAAPLRVSANTTSALRSAMHPLQDAVAAWSRRNYDTRDVVLRKMVQALGALAAAGPQLHDSVPQMEARANDRMRAIGDLSLLFFFACAVDGRAWADVIEEAWARTAPLDFKAHRETGRAPLPVLTGPVAPPHADGEWWVKRVARTSDAVVVMTDYSVFELSAFPGAAAGDVWLVHFVARPTPGKALPPLNTALKVTEAQARLMGFEIPEGSAAA